MWSADPDRRFSDKDVCGTAAKKELTWHQLGDLKAPSTTLKYHLQNANHKRKQIAKSMSNFTDMDSVDVVYWIYMSKFISRTWQIFRKTSPRTMCFIVAVGVVVMVIMAMHPHESFTMTMPLIFVFENLTTAFVVRPSIEIWASIH